MLVATHVSRSTGQEGQVATTPRVVGSPELLAKVMGYQNPDLVNRLREKLSLDEVGAVQLFEDAKRFLYLCGTTQGFWSPTEPIDEGWHNFILFTQDYAQFCHEHFGRFIHHNPKRIGSVSTGLSPMETLSAAKDIFGVSLSGNWAPDSMRDSADCSKSGCDCSPDTGGGGSECTPE